MKRHAQLAIAFLLLLVIAVLPAPAQPSSDEQEQQALAHFRKGEYEQARDLLLVMIEDDPRDASALYNLACAQAQLGEKDKAVTRLAESARAGFLNIHHLQRDSDLDPIRSEPGYLRLLEQWDDIVRDHTQARIKQARKRLDGRYIEDVDEAHRIIYVSGVDRASHDAMKRLVGDLFNAAIRDIFGDGLNVPVVVVIPTPSDYHNVIDKSYISGIYVHDHYQLISRNSGGALLHELVHALHWAHMDRIGQKHPIWVQEGLACLYEDVELGSERAVYLPSWRTNIVRRLATSNRLTDWPRLFGMDRKHYMKRPRQSYAESRAIFMYLADQDKLRAWYDAYIEGFDEDSTGVAAMERVFEQPIDETQQEFAQWVKQQLPQATEAISPGGASLGVTVNDNGANDGVLIKVVHPGTGAARAGLQTGDVILALNGEEVHSLRDITRELSVLSVGKTVKLKLRRGSERFTCTVELTAR
ncbi:MAG: PDZ domain-containing protein [Phycisphaerales bacterium]|nr:PDZ domain-containing protein [Phycisphaerales bacterium]